MLGRDQRPLVRHLPAFAGQPDGPGTEGGHLVPDRADRAGHPVVVEIPQRRAGHLLGEPVRQVGHVQGGEQAGELVAPPPYRLRGLLPGHLEGVAGLFPGRGGVLRRRPGGTVGLGRTDMLPFRLRQPVRQFPDRPHVRTPRRRPGRQPRREPVGVRVPGPPFDTPGLRLRRQFGSHPADPGPCVVQGRGGPLGLRPPFSGTVAFGLNLLPGAAGGVRQVVHMPFQVGQLLVRPVGGRALQPVQMRPQPAWLTLDRSQPLLGLHHPLPRRFGLVTCRGQSCPVSLRVVAPGGERIGRGSRVRPQIGGVDGEERGGRGIGRDQPFEGAGDRLHVVERPRRLDQQVVLHRAQAPLQGAGQLHRVEILRQLRFAQGQHQVEQLLVAGRAQAEQLRVHQVPVFLGRVAHRLRTEPVDQVPSRDRPVVGVQQ